MGLVPDVAGAWAVVPAAGSSTRMGGMGPKCLLPLAGRPVVSHALAVLEACPAVDGVALVVPAGEEGLYRSRAVEPYGFSKVRAVVAGAATRRGSVACGLEAVPHRDGLVLVHDGARPLLEPEVVSRVLEAARERGAAAAAVAVSDTVKRAGPGGRVVETLDRSGLFLVQTPQAFSLPLLREAHRRAAAPGASSPAATDLGVTDPAATDDAALVESMGVEVFLVPGRPENFKITTPEDLEVAAAVLGARPGAAPAARVGPAAAPGAGPGTPGLRIGLGYDVHPLAPGRPLRLGGEEIPHHRGLLGHSDADVLCHAVADALLGAAALGDIGRHFPPTDPAWAGASSLDLLGRVRDLLHAAGLEPLQVDAVVVAEEPRLAPYIEAMRRNLSHCLGLAPGVVGVKATTSEGLGPLGRGEGMCAWAVAVAGPRPARA